MRLLWIIVVLNPGLSVYIMCWSPMVLTGSVSVAQLVSQESGDGCSTLSVWYLLGDDLTSGSCGANTLTIKFLDYSKPLLVRSPIHPIPEECHFEGLLVTAMNETVSSINLHDFDSVEFHFQSKQSPSLHASTLHVSLQHANKPMHQQMEQMSQPRSHLRGRVATCR